MRLSTATPTCSQAPEAATLNRAAFIFQLIWVPTGILSAPVWPILIFAHAYRHTNGYTHCNAKCDAESYADIYAYTDGDSDSNCHAYFYTKAYPNPQTSTRAPPSSDTTLERKGIGDL